MIKGRLRVRATPREAEPQRPLIGRVWPENGRPGAYLQAAAGSQRHFSLVKISLWAQSQPQ